MDFNLNWKITFSNNAKKFLKKIDNKIRIKILFAVDEISKDPYGFKTLDIIKMKSYEDLFRKRVGDYRIVYMIKKNIIEVFIVEIDHRKDIYKNLK